MRNVFLAGGAVGVAIVVALPLVGGLSYRRSTDYLEAERFPAPFTTVYIQSAPMGTGWGNPAFLGFSVFGPPYDLLIQGTLPSGDPTTSLELTDLVVEADGVPVIARPRVVVPVEEVAAHQGRATVPGRQFLFVSPAITAGTPRRVRVSGTVKPVSSKDDRATFFVHVFEVRRTRVLALGRWSWNL